MDKTSENSYSLKISGRDGFNLDKVISENHLNRIISIIFSPHLSSSTPDPIQPIPKEQPQTGKHSRSRKSRSYPRTNAPSVRGEIESAQVVPNMPGYPTYWKDLNTKADRALLLVALAKEIGLEEVNSKEISRLADKIGDHIEAKNIRPILAGHHKSGHVVLDIKSGMLAVKILEPGREYLINMRGSAGEANGLVPKTN